MPILSAYHFAIRVYGSIFGFQEISGLEKELETEIYQEGGRNDRVLLFPKRVSKATTLTMKKGISKGKEPPFIQVGEFIPSLSLEVYDHDAKTILKTYIFQDLIITKWEVSELKAQEGNLLINTFQVAYGDFYVK